MNKLVLLFVLVFAGAVVGSLTTHDAESFEATSTLAEEPVSMAEHHGWHFRRHHRHHRHHHRRYASMMENKSRARHHGWHWDRNVTDYKPWCT
jgi:hypothetical protein